MTFFNQVKFKLTNTSAKLPRRATAGAAGFDLCSTERIDVPPGCQVTIDTGVAMAIPPGWFGRIMPRSGWAVRHGVNVHAGLIDSDYRGSVKVCLINHGNRPLEIHDGDRIAQIVFCPFLSDAVEVAELDDTERGDSGFGSTGLQ
ncbi:MAG: dUTP diphosphatase [Saprospiraceae bacterium]|nr:dUTP diphosphatase [Saprospiraceae bacterium]